MQQQTTNKFYRDAETRGQVGRAIGDYLRFFDASKGGDVAARRADYTTMINHYYDLVTDFYEQGWGKSFHFASRKKGESFDASLIRSEHYFALRLGLNKGMRVLDVGCGVGGPMRNIARFSGATIEGVNNNEYQLTKVKQYNEDAGLSDTCSGFKGDFMKLDVAERSYDAAYAIEATCHAPDKVGAFKEIHRVLKPGSLFTGFEWATTAAFDANNAEHQRIKKGIETGDSLPDLATIPEVRSALVDAGFEVIECRDAADECDAETSWYLPLVGEKSSPIALRRGRMGRALARRTIGTLERLKIAPKGSVEVSQMLGNAAEALIEGGETGIFTPNVFFLARRPS